jgi:hypothetical protein
MSFNCSLIDLLGNRKRGLGGEGGDAGEVEGGEVNMGMEQRGHSVEGEVEVGKTSQQTRQTGKVWKVSSAPT